MLSIVSTPIGNIGDTTLRASAPRELGPGTH